VSGSRCRVLVVEDDGLFRCVLGETLAAEGHEVRLAADGFRALEILREWEPDLIVLDLGLPLMNGLAFRGHQRGIAGTAEIPVVILSAHRELLAEAETLGSDAILAKPCDLDRLVGTINHLAAARALPIPDQQAC
jgi:CheY-like chemotaxis protein